MSRKWPTFACHLTRNWIRTNGHDDGNRQGSLANRQHRWRGSGDDYVQIQPDQFARLRQHPFKVALLSREPCAGRFALRHNLVRANLLEELVGARKHLQATPDAESRFARFWVVAERRPRAAPQGGHRWKSRTRDGRSLNHVTHAKHASDLSAQLPTWLFRRRAVAGRGSAPRSRLMATTSADA